MLRTKLDHQIEAVAAWREVFGQLTPRFIRQFETWMERNSQPWKIVWVSWQQTGDGLEGKSQSSALAVLKQTPRSLNAVVDPKTATGKAGLIFGFESDQSFSVWQLRGPGEVRLVHRVNGQWTGTQSFKLPPREGATTLSLAIVGGAVALGVNGMEITRTQAAGQVGLYVEDGKARFRLGK